MTRSSNETLERIARRIPIQEPAYERMLSRRDRKRRNQRITAGVVGIAAFVAAVWIVTSVASLDRSEKSVVPAGTGPAQTGPAVAVPTETGPAETGSTAAPASAGEPDVQEAATCRFVVPRARAHLELTYSGDWIDVRFVLHQMTLPGHRWRIVLRHASTGGAPPHADDWHVIFEGIRLARGDSGDITVQQRVADPSGLDFVAARASDRQTGQFCRVRAGLL